ncbi:MAG TPA: monovalent cation/H+ antiporter complex subunit F [Mycobacteriales bacterium]|nr:monovalent cation/H+ antiporter complex subunit F [Mycobacteriales bacterium]
MNTWLAACCVLLALGLAPALWVGAKGDAVRRLVGLELASATAVMALMAFTHAVEQPSYLIVPLTLTLLSIAGTLVFTRLLGPRP